MSIADKYTTLTTEKIPKVYEAGYEKGKAEGGDTTAAYEQGVADGKQAEYDAFWDIIQQNGHRTDFTYGFTNCSYSKNQFKPKYSIRATQLNTCFWSLCRYVNDIEDGIDFVEVFDNRGLVFDTSKCENFTSAFMWANIKRLGVIDVTGAKYNLTSSFGYGKIQTIEKLIVKETTPFVSSTFQNQATLENITFEGVIGQDLNLQWSAKLSRASITSAMNALSDTITGKSVTLSKTAVENAFSESEKTTIPFGFDTSYEGTNVTAVDNGDGTVTVNGFVSGDVEFNYEDAVGTFTAGSYIISVPEIDYGYVGFECYDLDGNKLTEEYAGDYTWALNTDKSFVIKACVYLQYGEYTDYVIPYPAIQLANSFDALIATKPNWTINLV